MISLQTKLYDLGNALNNLPSIDNVFHYWRFGVEAPYLIWAEDSEVALETDNHKGEQGIAGAIEFFTLTEFDEACDEIQEALNSLENCYWRYDGATYEEDTNLIHHSWRWRIV